jgi:hypothetical protein
MTTVSVLAQVGELTLHSMILVPTHNPETEVAFEVGLAIIPGPCSTVQVPLPTVGKEANKFTVLPQPIKVSKETIALLTLGITVTKAVPVITPAHRSVPI